MFGAVSDSKKETAIGLDVDFSPVGIDPGENRRYLIVGFSNIPHELGLENPILFTSPAQGPARPATVRRGHASEAEKGVCL